MTRTPIMRGVSGGAGIEIMIAGIETSSATIAKTNMRPNRNDYSKGRLLDKILQVTFPEIDGATERGQTVRQVEDETARTCLDLPCSRNSMQHENKSGHANGQTSTFTSRCIACAAV